MLDIRLCARSDIGRWGARRWVRLPPDEVDDLADDALIRVMGRVDRRLPGLRLRHEVFCAARTVYRGYLMGRDAETQAGDDINLIADPVADSVFDRAWDSPVLRHPDAVAAGTIWTPKTMLTVPRAAYEAGVSRRHMYQLVAWGQIDSVVFGGRRVVTVGALRRFIAARAAQRRSRNLARAELE